MGSMGRVIALYNTSQIYSNVGISLDDAQYITKLCRAPV